VNGDAPGAPGSPPTWTTGAKDFVTTAPGSKVWVTLGDGILNEVYWPSTGRPQVRDLGFLVAGPGWWREVKQERRYTISAPDAATPLPTVVHEAEGYRLTLEVVPDPRRDAVLIRYQLDGDGLRLYPLLAPHIEMHRFVDQPGQPTTTPGGMDNVAEVTSDALVAAGPGGCLCLVPDRGFLRSSAGYVGQSDGWQDFDRNGTMTWTYDRAGPGDVAMIGELPEPSGVLALAFAENREGAEILARESLAGGADDARQAFTAAWREWTAGVALPETSAADPPELADAVRQSAVVMRAHEDDTFPGAFVASLAIPWGNARSDLGGYHLVWPRDAVETGLGLLALGQADAALRLLRYLMATQGQDGHWVQNFYPDGTPFWTGVQLDETALPVVLAAKLDELGHDLPVGTAATVQRAVEFLVRNGPLSDQDRWEENRGSSPFTLAVLVAAMVAGAKFLPDAESRYVLALADSWNERIEEWTYALGNPFGIDVAIEGHYVRIGPPASEGGLRGFVPIRNRPTDQSLPAAGVVGMEFLYLARLGLRDPGDRRMTDSMAVAEAVLGKDLPTGRAYYRYNDDGYGEGPGGVPFTGAGQGRAWPLLAGERGHYAVARGDDPLPQVRAMLAMRGKGGLIPEQVWDEQDIPDANLYFGHPSGSAMPLVWAHAELAKLAVARRAGRPFEQLEAVTARYGARIPSAPVWYWRDAVPFDVLPPDRGLVVEGSAPFTLHLGHDGWQDVADRRADSLGLGMYGAAVSVEEMAGWANVQFTRDYETGWEGRDHSVDRSRPAAMYLHAVEPSSPAPR
jgi:glucoamylase